MQTSELYRRGVVLPLDNDAELQLRTCDCEPNANVDCVSLDDDELFEALWLTGVFPEINQQCDALIGDYEACFVEADQMSRVIDIIECFWLESEDEEYAQFLHEFHALARKALERRRPLLFEF